MPISKAKQIRDLKEKLAIAEKSAQTSSSELKILSDYIDSLKSLFNSSEYGRFTPRTRTDLYHRVASLIERYGTTAADFEVKQNLEIENAKLWEMLRVASGDPRIVKQPELLLEKMKLPEANSHGFYFPSAFDPRNPHIGIDHGIRPLFNN